MKILIVDDELVSRKKMQKIMENFGTCESKQNGIEAIDSFKKSLEFETPFQLVTLDVEMPEMDGTEVLFELRELEKKFQISKHKSAKILMVTSHSERDTVITSIQAGCDDYVVKPFNKDTIVQKMNGLGFNFS
ncbi:MAG: response regulator [SAR324 cluster bacterium]|nr:response regulator [SAR324 cluster bacterium]